MKRSIVTLLVTAFVPLGGGHALAEQTLLQAGTRHVQQIVRAESAVAARASATTPAGALSRPVAAAAQQSQQGGQAPTSRLGKRTRLMLVLGGAAAIVGGFYAIDSRVENNTPSTLGTRRD